MKREPWHSSLLESLAILGDIPLQARTWIDGDDTVFLESPTELICQVFDDAAIDDVMKAGGVLPEDTRTILQEINSLVERIDLEQRPKALLNDNDWRRLTSLAQRAHDSLQRALSSDC